MKWGTVVKIRRSKIWELHQALLAKWLWRFAKHHENSWRKFIRARYGEMVGEWCILKVRGSS